MVLSRRSGLMWAAIIAMVVLPSCASVTTQRHFPVMGCHITCNGGAKPIFEHQHLCFGGASRFFEDVLVKDERIERNDDGTIKADEYITEKGDYPTKDVELQSCYAYIDQLINARPAEQRGVHPGEDPTGHPQH